jgi:hypothetical protein
MACTVNTWSYHRHRFIEHLAEGKTPEESFEDLA